MRHSFLIPAALALLVAAAFAAEPDMSTPKKSLMSLMDTMGQGDIDGVKKFFATPASEDETNLLDFGMGNDRFTVALALAIKAKFPNASVPNYATQAAAQKKRLDDMLVEKIDGTKATLTTREGAPGMPATIEMFKEGESWKFALKPSIVLREIPKERIPLEKALKAVYVGIIVEIKEGKFATAEAAIKAVEARRQEVTIKNLPPLK